MLETLSAAHYMLQNPYYGRLSGENYKLIINYIDKPPVLLHSIAF